MSSTISRAAPPPPRAVPNPAPAQSSGGAADRRRVLLLVLDGMRPGSLDPKLTPNLASLAAGGVTYTRSRTGFPSETMVGASELFTGAYPERSGVTGNWMIVPGSPNKGIELKTREAIEKMRRAYGGRALGSASMFQALAGAGLTSAVIGKEGPAELAWYGGATWAVSTAGALASRRGRELERERGTAPIEALVDAAAGPAPKRGDRNDSDRSSWFVRAARALDAAHAPDLLAVWLTDPDSTQHMQGLDSRNQRSSLATADRAVGELLADLRERGQLDNTDIVLTSDHGFSDHINRDEVPLADVLSKAGLDVTHVVGSGNQHMVRFRQPPTARDFAQLRDAIAGSSIAPLVRTVIENPREGVRGDRRGDRRLTGRDLRNGSRRAGDAYVVYQRDEHRPGGPGHVVASGGPTIAGHGSMGWSDLNNMLVLAGPRVERARAGIAGPAPGLRTDAAAGIVDLAPTILHLLGAPAPASMQGRVLQEALTTDPATANARVEPVPSRTSTAWSDVQLGARTVRTGLTTEWAGGTQYFVGLHTREQ